MNIFERISRIAAIPVVIPCVIFMYTINSLIMAIVASILYAQGELSWNFNMKELEREFDSK